MWQSFYNMDSCWMSLIFFLLPMHLARIPLRKVKSIRENLREKGFLKNFLDEHPHDMIRSRLTENSAPQKKNTTLPLRNYLDVSGRGGWPHSAPWCSGLALGLLWRCQKGGRAGGAPAESKSPWGGRTGASYPEENAFPPLTLGMWLLGPAMTRWQVNIHFCAKDMSSPWGKFFF